MIPSSAARRAVAILAAGLACAWLVVAATPASAQSHHPHHHHHGHHVIFVGQAKTDRHHHHGGRHHNSCRRPDFNKIADAVSAARPGSTIVVCPGVYAEDVLVNKPLRLIGLHATIDATGLENAMQVVSSDVSVRGFNFVNANGEGLLVGVDTAADAKLLPKSVVLSHVLVDHVRAVNNDRGFNGTEKGNCKYPGDCGGGIHLNVTSWSAVRNSFVARNADGILLTDDYGPASHNLIDRNIVNDNPTECGIVLPSHNPAAVNFDKKTFAVISRNPTKGGIYDNVVSNNVALRNGTAKAPPQFGGGGSGSGLGLFGSGPGTGVYDNLIVHNFAAGNGLAGLAIHAHHPGGEDINGNRIVDNKFGTNNLGGDPFDGPPGPSDFKTTGIAVFSVPPATMVIAHNLIVRNKIGIWLSKTVKAIGLRTNRFLHVRFPVVVG